jgi:hypothetical protein
MADIYTVSTTLDSGEAFSKVKPLAMGKYKYVLTRTSGNGDDITLEAELVVQGLRKTKYHAPCPNTATVVEFKVDNDGDLWEITITNSSSTSTAKVTSKLTKE